MKTGNADFDAGVQLGLRLAGRSSGASDSIHQVHLTQKELQYLIDLNKFCLGSGQDNAKVLRAAVAELYSKVDKNKPETEETYKKYLQLKEFRDKVHESLRTLTAIQSKFKSVLKSPW